MNEPEQLDLLLGR
jgi:hypothetical protein